MSRTRKMDEAEFRADLHDNLSATFDCVSMETKLGDGLPDEHITCKMTGQSSWVELKQYNDPNFRDSFRFEVKPEQSVFAYKRVITQNKVNALVLGRVNRQCFIALPAVTDVDWTIWVRRRISLIGPSKYPIIRMSSYAEVAELLRDNLCLRYAEQKQRIPSANSAML